MPVTRFILVRHGETIANREFRYIGASDNALTEPGQVQAVQLASALSVLPVAAVYSVWMVRTFGGPLDVVHYYSRLTGYITPTPPLISRVQVPLLIAAA